MNDTEQLIQRLRDHRRMVAALPEPSERRAIRERAGATQRDIADILGVSRATVAHYEAGSKNPRSGERLNSYLSLLQSLGDL